MAAARHAERVGANTAQFDWARAGIDEAVSAHWLRHAHGSHSLDRGATLAEVQATLGHANVATTSGYLHARPNTSSGLKLDEGIFR
jgi:integrase/recombinase XerD